MDANAVGIEAMGVIVEYIEARNAYEEATRARGFAPAKSLPYHSPIMLRYRNARHAFDRLVFIPHSEG